MRSVLASLLGFPLLMLLALTTPIGTGQGVHRTLLLHPLFSHTHIVDGQVVWHEQADRIAVVGSLTTPATPDNPSIGAAAGASPAPHAVASTPTLVFHDLRLDGDAELRRRPPEIRAPVGRVEAPPDPPPTFAA